MNDNITSPEDEKNTGNASVSDEIDTNGTSTEEERNQDVSLTKEEDFQVHPKLAHLVEEESLESKSEKLPEETSKVAQIKEQKIIEEETPQEQQQDQQESRPTRLDERIAELHIKYLALTGNKIPSREEIYETLKNGTYKEKEKSLHAHLRELKMLRAVESEELSQDDILALTQEQKEEIRKEIIREQEEKQEEERIEQEKNFFLSFIESHKDIVEGSKEFDKDRFEAVNTLFKSGMRIDLAYKTVEDATRKAEERAKKITENKSVSGVFSGSQSDTQSNDLTWEDIAEIQQSDPGRYRELVRKGQLPKD